MLRLFSVLFLLFIYTAAANAEIDPMYDLDVPPDLSFQIQTPAQYKKEYDIKKGTSSEVKPPQTVQTPQKQSGIKGFFSKFKKNKKPAPKFDSPPTQGYKGNLPNIKSEFGYKTPKKSNIKNDGDSAENYTPEEFQKSRTDDPLFLDVILNKGQPSQYTNDMIKIMRFLESFRSVIENHEDIQKFNANVNLLDLHARRIEKLYADTPDGMTPSYWLLMDLSYKAKVLGNLKYDANYYSKVSPVAGTKYDKENLLSEDNKLLIELDKTVFEIRQLSK